MKENKSPV